MTQGVIKMTVYCTSDNKMYKVNDNGKVTELISKRAEIYRQNVSEIRKRNEWKQSGSGAAFTGTLRMTDENSESAAYICGLANSLDGRIIYSINLGEVGGLYYKDENGDESHIIAAQNFAPFEMNNKENRLAVSVEYGDTSRHISVYELPSGNCTELTDGDTVEECPCWSKVKNELYFSTAGIGRNKQGIAAALSPRSLACYNFDTNEMDEICSDENTDFFCPKTDVDGNLYYIKRPYKTDDSGNSWLDLLLFPVRIIKAIGGFLNAFSILFGGESLSSDGKGFNNPLKAKQKDEKELLIAGNIINAEKIEKENSRKGDKNAGIIPHSWQLVKRFPSGDEEIIRKGVLDYEVCDNGNIVISDGKHIIMMSPNGEEKLIGKCRLAQNVIICNE